MTNINAQAKQKALDLCKVGEYRKAAILALHARKTEEPFDPTLDFALPTSLIRCGRGKTALKLIISSIPLCEEPNPDTIKLIFAALANTSFSKEELYQGLDFVKGLRLKSSQIAGITSHIQSKEMRELFLEEAKRRFNLSSEDLLFSQASVAYSRGDNGTALRCLQELLTKGTPASESALLMATILNEIGSLYLARRYICIAIKLNSSDISAFDLLGQILFQESKWKAVRRSYELINRITGDDISMLNMRFTLPLVAISSQELTDSLSSYKQLVQSSHQESKWMGIEQSLRKSTPLCHSFFLAYQGDIRLRRYLEEYSNLIRSTCEQVIHKNRLAHSHLKTGQVHFSAAPKANGKIKLGFVSKNFAQHSNLQAHEGLIRHLDRSLFEIVLIHRQGCTKDLAHKILNESADQVVYLENDFGGNCKRIAELQLDILYFTDIGMYPLDSVLAMVGLAPKQVTGWGIPHTSGLKEVDCYMRSTIFDDCEDESEYTETLTPIQGYLGYFEIDRSALESKTRDYFLLPPDRFLIGCLQSIHKIHPDFDAYLEAVARLDESILIVIAASEVDALNHRFVRRIRRTAPTAHGQICFVQKMNMGDYYSLNNLLDLNLDTVHYGAGITFIQTAWCGPPCVTQRANTVRASVVSRSYEYAGIVDPPIASSKAEYVSIVDNLMKNERRRLDLKREIQAKCEGTVYNNQVYIQSCQDFFINLSTTG